MWYTRLGSFIPISISPLHPLPHSGLPPSRASCSTAVFSFLSQSTSKWKLSLPPCVTFKPNTNKSSMINYFIPCNCTLSCALLSYTLMCTVILFEVWLCTIVLCTVLELHRPRSKFWPCGILALWPRASDSNSWSVNRRYKDIWLMQVLGELN